MKGTAVAYGAVSIVNAIATWKGAALGVALRTQAEVELSEREGDIVVKMEDREEDPKLTKFCVKKVLDRYQRKIGARVTTRSEIPVGKGLKSSSSVSNAVVLATLSALDECLDDFDAVKLGVEASLEAGVSVTGALDDACACFFGGVCVTDNANMRLLKREDIDESLEVLIYVPAEKLYTKNVDVEAVRRFSSLADEVHKLALDGEYWRAMTLNGFAYSAALGISPEPALFALASGALAAGLSGKGPAIAAVCRPEKVNEVLTAWSRLEGSVIRTHVNNKKAGAIENW